MNCDCMQKIIEELVRKGVVSKEDAKKIMDKLAKA
jgi:polyhydroxyalkanoate synthesis regulator phasin